MAVPEAALGVEAGLIVIGGVEGDIHHVSLVLVAKVGHLEVAARISGCDAEFEAVQHVTESEAIGFVLLAGKVGTRILFRPRAETARPHVGLPDRDALAGAVRRRG